MLGRGQRSESRASVVAGDRCPARDGGLWALHDGTLRASADLTVLDVADVLREGTVLLADIRRGRYRVRGDQTRILRVHRSACLARSVRSQEQLGDDARSELDALICLDERIAATENAWRDFVRRGLPNLVAGLVLAGALHRARCERWLYAEGDADR